MIGPIVHNTRCNEKVGAFRMRMVGRGSSEKLHVTSKRMDGKKKDKCWGFYYIHAMLERKKRMIKKKSYRYAWLGITKHIAKQSSKSPIILLSFKIKKVTRVAEI